MTKVNVKGYEIELKVTKSAHDRKSVLYANKIIEELKKINIVRDEVKVKTNTLGSSVNPAILEIWTGGHYLRFKYSLAKRFVDNLIVIFEVIKREVVEIKEGRKDMQQFYNTFTESTSKKDIAKELEKARKVLDVSEKEDIESINKKYKDLAKKSHPDLGGDILEFKKINKAHKLIKKEMGL